MPCGSLVWWVPCRVPLCVIWMLQRSTSSCSALQPSVTLLSPALARTRLGCRNSPSSSPKKGNLSALKDSLGGLNPQDSAPQGYLSFIVQRFSSVATEPMPSPHRNLAEVTSPFAFRAAHRLARRAGSRSYENLASRFHRSKTLSAQTARS